MITEYIIIEVINDKFSLAERTKLEECIKDIKQGRLTETNRYIVMSDKKVNTNEKIILSISNGTLYIDEVKKITQCIRDIEQNKPMRHIKIFMNLPDKTIAEIQEINNSISPNFPVKGIIKLKKDANKTIKTSVNKIKTSDVRNIN